MIHLKNDSRKKQESEATFIWLELIKKVTYILSYIFEERISTILGYTIIFAITMLSLKRAKKKICLTNFNIFLTKFLFPHLLSFFLDSSIPGYILIY